MKKRTTKKEETTLNAKVYCNGTRAKCLHEIELTAGMAGAPIAFEFSPEWDGLTKVAVFTSDGSKDRILGENGETTVPHEILTTPGMDVTAAVFARREDGTTWPSPSLVCRIGRVQYGADPSGDESYPPTPTVGEQAIALAGAAKEIADAAVKTVNGVKPDETGNVNVSGGSGAAIELDTTLTQSGKAADAKAVGDALAKVGGEYLVPMEVPDDPAVGELWYVEEEEEAVGVTSVNGQTGDVVLTAKDVGALSADTEIPAPGITEETDPTVEAWAKTAVPAEVGQYFRVSAVDANGNVTAVEAVDAPSGGGEWDYEATIEIAEAVHSITINTDENGEPLRLKEARVFAWVQLSGVSSNLGVTFRCETDPGVAPPYVTLSTGYGTADGRYCMDRHIKINEFGLAETESLFAVNLPAYTNYTTGMSGNVHRDIFPVHYNGFPLYTKVIAIDQVEIGTAATDAMFATGVIKIVGRRA